MNIAILFGGSSTEHEVSVITGMQILNNIDTDFYVPIPVYISKTGEWFSGSDKLCQIETYKNLDQIPNISKNLFFTPNPSVKGLVENPKKTGGFFTKPFFEKIDVIFPCFHGNLGENGGIQGLLELSGIPFIGSGILGSAIGMDKISSKAVFSANSIPSADYIYFLKEEWVKNKNEIIEKIEKVLKYPVFVKPSNGGSSVGVGYSSNKKGLEEAIEVAKFYDRRILVEKAIKNRKEVNISVIGYKNLEVSECEQPISSSNVLSYEDKYSANGGKSQGMASLKRIIPAPIKATTKEKIENFAKMAFKALDCSGIARIDFLVSENEKEIYINEINTIPGSMSYYLWEPKGVKFKELITKLINLAIERNEDQKTVIHMFNSNILENFSGTKGAKN